MMGWGRGSGGLRRGRGVRSGFNERESTVVGGLRSGEVRLLCLGCDVVRRRIG